MDAAQHTCSRRIPGNVFEDARERALGAVGSIRRRRIATSRSTRSGFLGISVLLFDGGQHCVARVQ